jgi:hypothetical protein
MTEIYNKKKLWKKSINNVINDNNKKLDDYFKKEHKRITKLRLLKLGTHVIVTDNKKKLEKMVNETPGLSNIKEKYPYLGCLGYVINSDTYLGHSKICFKDNKKIWFPITALELHIPVTDKDIKYIKTPNISVARYDSPKKQIKSIYECVEEYQNRSNNSYYTKRKVNFHLLEKASMGLKELSLYHEQQKNKLIKTSNKFYETINKIKKDRCYDRIKLPPI